MKNLIGISILLTLLFGATSCVDDEPTVQVDFYYRTIDSIEIGPINRPNEITEIKTYYTRVNSCERFFDYEYYAFDYNRQVRLITGIAEEEGCEEISEADYAIIKFRPRYSGPYVFKFWNGYNEDGSPKYIEKEIFID